MESANSDRGVPPFLRWAGSKRKLLSKLRPYWDRGSFQRYVEPFMGSACLFFELQPRRAILGDTNRPLVETFQAVARYPKAISQRLARLPRDEATYYKMRSLESDTLSYLDRAVRFVFLNRYCFNGIYRTNSRGEFNVPYGGDRTGNAPSEEAIVRCSKLLIGPVSRAYAGWQPDVDSRTTAIVGLGGERGVALGMIEHLEVTDAWVFQPIGTDGRFDIGATEANRELIERIGQSRVVPYEVMYPFDCFCSLEPLVFGAMATERVVLVPLGPKIFSVVALLVAELYWPNVPVWRASSDQDGAPLDREADGSLVWLQADFGCISMPK